MRMCIFLYFLFMSIMSWSFQKVTYEFSKDPIDVVIVCHKKDVRTLDLVIDGIEENIGHRNIIVSSDEKLTDKAIWFDEAQFPFTKKEIAYEIFQDTELAEAYMVHKKTHIGWIYQQLCKLYALFFIPNISDNILVVDADTIFLRPVTFMQENGAPLFNYGDEYHVGYFEHIHRLIPNLKKVYRDKSGISHHMLFQKCIMEDLFSMIRAIHNEEPWKVICHTLDHKWIYSSSVSEYELYFNFTFSRTHQARTRKLKWRNMSFRDFNKVKDEGLYYVSCHTYKK